MNKFKFIGVVILLFAIGFVFMNYGNINSHPTINSLIVEKFISANNLGDMPDFKNYSFKLYKPKLKGDFITKTGYFNPSNSEVSYVGDRSVGKNNSIYTEEARKVTPQKWIEHGGYSADVPEVPASLRHFYDPSRKKSERYLTDDINSPVMKFAESLLAKPKTNGVDWALGTGGNYGVLEHIYTWEHGKQYMRGALEQPNIDKRNNYMAKAWRSLGETLHMIADNGCPVHVRNDGHPAFLVNLFDVVEMFGNPDPYEEQMELKDISKFDVGSIPFDLRDKFRAAKTTRDIAHELAVFTNGNFFTNETISGTDWRGNTVIPITNPTYIHKSPKIAMKNYDDKYYRRTIGKKEVLLCTDKWFFGEYNIPSRIPHVDEACVESQAKVLIPTIKEAGVNVMKLFIPKLEIKITEIDENGYISGTVKHKTDKEYTKEIRYNGSVKIMNGRSVISEINASGGQFTGQIEVDKNMKVVAGIEFGGIEVYSKEFELEEKKEMLKIDGATIQIWCGDAVFEDVYLGDPPAESIRPNAIGISISFEETPIKNNEISSVLEYDEDYLTIKKTLLLKFTDNNKFKSLSGFSFKKTWARGNGGVIPEDGTTIIDGLVSAEGNNIPFKVEYGRNNYISFTYKGDISKYLSQINSKENEIFKSSDKEDDNIYPSSHLLKKYGSVGEIKIELHFSKEIYDWNSILND